MFRIHIIIDNLYALNLGTDYWNTSLKILRRMGSKNIAVLEHRRFLLLLTIYLE